MNKKIYKLTSVLIIFFTAFLMNKNVVFGETISLPDYCKNPSSKGDIKNGHLCASADQVVQCNIAMVSAEEEGLPTKCPDDGKIRLKEGSDEGAKDCRGYYYSFIDTSDDMFVADENHFVYRQMVCNGVTYKGEKLNYFYISNGKIKSVEEAAPEFYNKVKSDISSDTADSNMGQTEADTDKTNEKKSTIKNADVGNLDPNSTSITINCSDYSALHTVYVVMLIIAPIIVIVLGSIDYAKAVMASNLEKMEKFKKRFPIRLTLLVVLFLVPLLIKLILSLNSDLSNTLLNCVVNGKDAEIKLKAANINTDSANNTNSGSVKYTPKSTDNNSSGSNNTQDTSSNSTTTTVNTNDTSNQTSSSTNTSSGCSKCESIPSSYTSARAACEKANNCKILNKK